MLDTNLGAIKFKLNRCQFAQVALLR